MYQNPKSKLFREACSKNLEFLPKLLFAFPKYISSSATDFSLKKMAFYKFILAWLCYILVTPIVTVSCSSTTIVNQGDNLSCECKGTGGNPPADVIWYKNNTEIVTGKEKAILRLTNVSKDDSGTYRCEAKSSEKAKNITEIQLIIIGEYDSCLN